MSEFLTKSRARNIFYGGSLFFIGIFAVLSIDSHLYVVNESTSKAELTDEVILGKHVWEKHACINCHTLHGEGAYFAPEVGNVMTRWGVLDDPDDAAETLGSWMEAQPSRIEGRRQMPFFDLTKEEVRGLSEFLRWADKTNTQDWPPNDAG